MTQEHKEKWVDEVLNSTDKIQHVWVPEGLFEQIEDAVKPSKRVKLIPLRTASITAASIALLVIANLYFITNNYQEPNTSRMSKSGIESVVEYYGIQEQDVNYGI